MQQAKQASTISKIALALAAALASIATASAIAQLERLPASIPQHAAPSAPGGFHGCPFLCLLKSPQRLYRNLKFPHFRAY